MSEKTGDKPLRVRMPIGIDYKSVTANTSIVVYTTSNGRPSIVGHGFVATGKKVRPQSSGIVVDWGWRKNRHLHFIFF